jgi:hypothetical protein
MKRVLLYSVVTLMVLVIATLILWHQPHNANGIAQTNSVTNAQTLMSQPNRSSPASVTNKNPDDNQPVDHMKEAGITPDMSPAERERKWAEWMVKEVAKFVPEQKPFAFYGKVIDKDNQAVAGASVHLGLRTASALDGTSNVDTISSENGNFSLAEGAGSHLHVDVWKVGYFTVSSRNQVEFDDTTGGGSSKENPVLFFLKKKGEGVDLITSQYGVHSDVQVNVPLDGTPVRLNFLNRETSGDGQIEFSNIKPDRLKQQKSNEWSFRMSIPDGGVVEENDEFPFEAPETGYQTTVAFNFKAGETNWTDVISRSYYIAFGSPRKYGWLHLDTQMYWGTRITYAINPDGTRNLEPK